MIEHIKILFLAIVAISCLTCFERADYNLPLFAFAIFLWDQPHPNVYIPSCIVTESETVLFNAGDMVR